ncbi:cell wall protein RBR3-like isoform X2 [Echeneis naucrates]|uniref:cell wall protein RBR3-like isoform X2 n=1 Tax=Echeneis naucrates TaxID=173247 RepID=UPI001113D175|nr:cell wall protein RBR3-like isoform X2 [Echeneis naucrates]
MAAVLFRRGAGLCFRGIHRELCRVAWRPQVALFSSKPTDGKLPQRTHIKKAKAKPAVDVAQLMERLSSQQRPGTAPPTAARPAKASSSPPSASSVKASTATPGDSSFPKNTGLTSITAPTSPPPKLPSSTDSKTLSQQLPLGITHGVTAAGVRTTSASPPTSTECTSSGPEAAKVQHQTEVENKAEGLPAAPSLPLSAHMNAEAAAGGPLMERTTEPSAETRLPPVEIKASVQAPAATTVDASPEKAQAQSLDLGVVNLLYTTRAEGAGEATVEAKADAVAQAVQTNSSDSLSATVEPLLKSEASVDACPPQSPGTAEPSMESKVEDLSHAALIQIAHKSEVLPLNTDVESTAESEAESSSGKADRSEQMTSESITLHSAHSKSPATGKTSSSSPLPVGVKGDSLRSEEKATQEQALTLESVTLAEVTAEVGNLETEVLQETSNVLEKEADAEEKEQRVDVKTIVEDIVSEDAADAEILTLDSISEASEAIEGKTSVVLEATFGSEQGLTRPPDILKLAPQDEMISQEAERESREEEGNALEAMSPAVTLAEAEACSGTMENKSLSEISAYPEKEAEILVGESRSGVKELKSDGVIEDQEYESVPLAKGDGQFEPGSAHTAAVGADDVTVSPTQKEVLLGQELVEEGTQTEVSGIEKDLDPVQRLFLEKIRDYNNIHRGPVEADPDYEKCLAEEVAKLQRLYGGGDLSSFPQFTFTGERDTESPTWTSTTNDP